MRRFGVSDQLTALAPVTVAALLIAFCLAGAELYSSSSGSAALDTQLDETCRSDSALTLPIPHEPRAAERVTRIGSVVPIVEPPRLWAIARPFITDTEVPRRLTVLHIDGVQDNVSPPLSSLAEGEIALSDTMLIELAAAVGDTIDVDGATLRITQRFDDPPTDPLPSFWCGYRDLLIPPETSDFRPVWAVASFDTLAALGEQSLIFREYRVVDEPLTLTEADQIRTGYAEAIEAWRRAFTNAPFDVERNELERVVGRAEAVRTTVDRNLAPVTLTGTVAGTIVLIAAGVLLARDRHRELRLLAVRGLPPWRIAARVAPRLALAVGTGAVLGWTIAWAAIRTFGPSSNLERGAVMDATTWVAVAAVAALATVAGVVAYVADGFADARRRRVHHRWVGLVVVAGAVALAGIALRTLDRDGGVRTFGVESRGGSLLAMGFPLFAVMAVTAVAGLLVALVAPRLRLTGARLRRALRLGWRRAVMDAGPLVAVVVAAAMAAGCFAGATALAEGAERQLADKALLYVGTDLAVDVFDPVDVPDEWAARTTLISKTDVRWDGIRGDLIGVDRATFADVAELRSDGAELSLEELIAQIGPTPGGEPLRAIGVGGTLAVGDVLEVEVPGALELVPVEVVVTATFFPGVTTGVPMLVVDIAEAEEVSRFDRSALLVRDPPAGALDMIRSDGVRTGVVLDADTAFDGSAYSALRWAYWPLAVLGMLFAVVALALQLLVVAARRSQRQIADAVMRRTGFTRRGLWWASIVETGVPLVVGSAIGLGAAMLAASLSVTRLDPMPKLAPPAEFLVPWNAVVATACVIPVWSAVVAFVIVRSTVNADPMRVFHGAA